jgi:hypothetical protein
MLYTIGQKFSFQEANNLKKSGYGLTDEMGNFECRVKIGPEGKFRLYINDGGTEKYVGEMTRDEILNSIGDNLNDGTSGTAWALIQANRTNVTAQGQIIPFPEVYVSTPRVTVTSEDIDNTVRVYSVTVTQFRVNKRNLTPVQDNGYINWISVGE